MRLARSGAGSSTSLPTISLVIVSHQGGRWLRDCLSSVLDSGYSNFELIILDNASTDETVRIIRHFAERDGRIRAHFNSMNVGFAQGSNFAAAIAKGDYLVFLNQDTVVECDWIEPIIELFRKDESIGVVQPLLLSMRYRGEIDSSGDFVDYYGHAFSRNEDWGAHDCYDGEEIFSARGAALAIRSDLASMLEYFDADFFASYEDIEICWRARLSGYRVVLCTRSRVYHYGGTGGQYPSMIFHETKNRLMMLLKNYELHNLILYNPIIINFLSASFVVFVLGRLRRRTSSHAAVNVCVMIRAFIWVFRNMRTILRKRALVQNGIRTVADSEIKRHMLPTNLPLAILFISRKISRHSYLQRIRAKGGVVSCGGYLHGTHSSN